MNKEEIQNKIKEINKILKEICDYLNEKIDYEMDLYYLEISNCISKTPCKKYYISVTTKEVLK